ncbi:DUF6489 family protein [Pleionea sediminis]|uniref:DUF6489 family protein n=1 Tax=Pleionea sediminis TaxID=2569479 RepID=UPI001186857B|nr:DUF6489 family protein [Pleionea sediminis]
MKVNFEIDATPEEWRKFFGMPDVSELHEDIINEAKKKIESGDFDVMKLLQQFMPADIQKMTEMQQDFWQNIFKQQK